MGLSTTSGARLYIGTTDPLSSSSTWTEIGHVEDIGEFGDESTEAEFIAVNYEGGLSRKQRFKGSRDAGVLTLTCGRDPSDAGQRELLEAEKTEEEYNFKIVADDAPAGDTPTTFSMRVLVMSAKLNFSGADDVTRITFTLAINSEIFEEAD